jgi:hypothetical protein
VCGEPPWRFAPLGVSPVPLFPQDKEGYDSVISHEENVFFIFEESRTLHSNQLVNEEKNDSNATTFRKNIKTKSILMNRMLAIYR